jgi:hypothetical protein
MLDKSIRELDRERSGLQSQEKKLIADIKKMAKQNQMGAVKVRNSPLHSPCCVATLHAYLLRGGCPPGPPRLFMFPAPPPCR